VADLKAIADKLVAAYDGATTLPPITAEAPEFSVADGYAVLHDIETRLKASAMIEPDSLGG
jgi:2-keto-4-pentenoate hydratase